MLEKAIAAKGLPLEPLQVYSAARAELYPYPYPYPLT